MKSPQFPDLSISISQTSNTCLSYRIAHLICRCLVIDRLSVTGNLNRRSHREKRKVGISKSQKGARLVDGIDHLGLSLFGRLFGPFFQPPPLSALSPHSQNQTSTYVLTGLQVAIVCVVCGKYLLLCRSNSSQFNLQLGNPVLKFCRQGVLWSALVCTGLHSVVCTLTQTSHMPYRLFLCVYTCTGTLLYVHKVTETVYTTKKTILCTPPFSPKPSHEPHKPIYHTS